MKIINDFKLTVLQSSKPAIVGKLESLQKVTKTLGNRTVCKNVHKHLALQNKLYNCKNYSIL